MATELEIFGPFEVPCDTSTRGKAKRIRKSDVKKFWDNPIHRSFADKQGCYIFAHKAGLGFKPWYAGKTSNSFKAEIFTTHKMDHYNDVLFQGYEATPVFFFVAPPGTKTKVAVNDLDDIETYLIQNAFKKNKELRNLKKTKNIPTWSIKGVVNPGKGKVPANATQFKKMLGI